MINQGVGPLKTENVYVKIATMGEKGKMGNFQ